MTKSKREEEQNNKASLKFYSDASKITTIASMNRNHTIQGGNARLKYNLILNPKHTDIIEIKTHFDKDEYSKEFNLVMMYNTIIEKRFYRNAIQLRKIMHPFDPRKIQDITEIRVSDIPKSNVCFKIKDAVDEGDVAQWLVVAPLVNKELFDDLLKQIRRVAE